MNKLKAVSLFSGAGGMDVGAKEAGFEISVASEIDPYACHTYRANHKTTVMIEGDIKAHFDEICSCSEIDLVIGGPPCQGFSVAGKMDIDDPRSQLVFSYCKVVERIRPHAFIMENVKSLGTLNKFNGIRERFLKRMKNAGYHVETYILNAKDFGVPQSRERVFFIGTDKQLLPISATQFERHKEKAVTLREAISHLGKAGGTTNPKVTKAKITLAKKPILRKSAYAGMLFNGQGRPLNPDAWSSTLPATMGGNRTPIIDEEHLYNDQASWVEEYHHHLTKEGLKPTYKKAPCRLRRLTIDEAALLQTFPSNYEFVGSQSNVFKQIGNAVPCKLAYVVASVVKENLL